MLEEAKEEEFPKECSHPRQQKLDAEASHQRSVRKRLTRGYQAVARRVVSMTALPPLTFAGRVESITADLHLVGVITVHPLPPFIFAVRDLSVMHQNGSGRVVSMTTPPPPTFTGRGESVTP
jgi:hypothetical protein